MPNERPTRHDPERSGPTVLGDRPAPAGLMVRLTLGLTLILGLVLAGLPPLARAATAADEPPLLRHRAPVSVTQPAAFVQLPLPAQVYALSQQPGLADLRLVDAGGQRVPFALLTPREDALRLREKARPASLYPLPAGPVGNSLPASVDLVVQGDRIQLRHRSGAAADPAGPGGQRPGAGWLIDLGEPAPQQPAPQRLHLRWSGPAEFSVAYRLEASDDLRRWRPAGGGQLMALASATGTLMQPLVPLESGAARFLRLVWADAGRAPQLVGADAITEQAERVAQDPPTLLRLVARPGAAEPGTAVALELDLGGVLPLQTLDLALPAGTRIVPLRVQQRTRADEPWRELTHGVVYRITREGGDDSRSPPLALYTRTRYLRLLPDARAPALDAAATPVLLQTALARLVFANQGTPPYALQVGLPPAAAAGGLRLATGALPIETLVPQLDQERARFGRAELGPFSEQPEAVQAAARAEMWAAWRPRLLWAVLLLGVAGLGWMVWRLARGRGA